MFTLLKSAIRISSSHSRLLIAVLATLSLAGCSSVQTTITRFHQIPPGQTDIARGQSIQVMAGDKRLEGTLEFNHHRQLLEQFLIAQGYRPVSADQAGDEPDLLAFLSYGIDGGRAERGSEPGGMTMGIGVGSGGHRFGTLSYLIPMYSTPTHSGSEVIYTSAIAIDIVERANLKDNDPQRLYEGRARSSSRCAAITPIFDEMLSALFEDFPGVSGQTQTKNIKSSGDNC